MRKLFLFIALLSGLSFAQIDEEFLLIGRNTGSKILSSGDTIRTMGFALNLLDNPNVPGPTLEMYEGDSILIDLWNVSQGAPHTIHLHGLDVNQQNDGVPHLSFDVEHMDHGYYRFKAPHAGTYLYHCHVVSSIHVQGGMYGMIIVHPKNEENFTWSSGYEYEFDAALMFSEIDTVWHNDTIIKHDTTSMFVAIPEYHPQYYLVNGLSDDQLTDSLEIKTAVDALTYIRLVNIGFKGNRVILPADFGATIIDSDGRPLPTPEVSDTVYLWPGERYGVIGSMPAEGNFEILVDYLDMNTDSLESTEVVPLVVEGFSAIMEAYSLKHEVYPNPTSEFVTVDIKEETGVFYLYDGTGKLVAQKSITGLAQIDVNELSPGLYIYKILATGNKVARGQIVVQ